MTLNEARYIVRMIFAYHENLLFVDSTDEDAKELDRMKARYQEAGRWSAGRETALTEFILRIAENGVPGGEYLDSLEDVTRWIAQRDLPLIERPQ